MSGSGQNAYNNYLGDLQNTVGNVTQVNPQSSNVDFGSMLNQQYGINQPNLSSILQPTNIQQQPQLDFSALANIAGNTANLAPAPQNFDAPTVDFNNQAVQALSNYAGQNLNDNVNAIRERFTAGGGSGTGTPAAFAEALTRSRGTTDLANTLAQFAQAQQGVQLQNNAMNSSNALTARGQDLQNYLGQQGINLSALQSMQGNQLAQRGQDLTAQLQAAGIDAGTAQALASGLLQQGNQQLQAQGMQADQSALLAQLMGQQGQFNAGQFNSAQQANQNAGLQGQQNQLNLAQLFGNSAGLTQQGQINALQQLFNSLNQVNAFGTTQAQTVQKPSGFQNFLSGISGITGMIPGVGTAVDTVKKIL